jgi:hypothetical protein
MAQAKAPKLFPRLGWSRCPVQRPHSTPKGERGYDRRKAKRELRKLVRDY